MELLSVFQEVNYLAVTVAAIVVFLIGWAWYSPWLFAGMWMEENRLSEQQLQNGNMLMIHGFGFVTLWIMSAVLAALLGSGATLQSGVNFGALVGIGLVGAALAMHALYERKTLRHFLINAGYTLIGLMIAGGIIGTWN